MARKKIALIGAGMRSHPGVSATFFKALSDAGIPTGISVAPVIPGLNEGDIPALLDQAYRAGARTATYSLLRLSGSVESVFSSRQDQWMTFDAAPFLHLYRRLANQDGRQDFAAAATWLEALPLHEPAKLLALQGLDAAGIEAAIRARFPDQKPLIDPKSKSAPAINDRVAWSAALRAILQDDTLHARLQHEAATRPLPPSSGRTPTPT